MSVQSAEQFLCITCLYPHIQTTTFSDQMQIHLPTAWRKHHSVNCTRFHSNTWSEQQQLKFECHFWTAGISNVDFCQYHLPLVVNVKIVFASIVFTCNHIQITAFLDQKQVCNRVLSVAYLPQPVSLFSNYHYWYFTYQQLDERSIQSCVTQWTMVSCSQRECRGY